MGRGEHVKPGDKIKYDNFEDGTEGDRRRAEELLKRGHTYTVRDVRVGDFETLVLLDEVRHCWFNDVMFEVVL